MRNGTRLGLRPPPVRFSLAEIAMLLSVIADRQICYTALVVDMEYNPGHFLILQRNCNGASCLLQPIAYYPDVGGLYHIWRRPTHALHPDYIGLASCTAPIKLGCKSVFKFSPLHKRPYTIVPQDIRYFPNDIDLRPILTS